MRKDREETERDTFLCLFSIPEPIEPKVPRALEVRDGAGTRAGGRVLLEQCLSWEVISHLSESGGTLRLVETEPFLCKFACYSLLSRR